MVAPIPSAIPSAVRDLIDLLACPACGATLQLRQGRLACHECDATYSLHPHIDLLPRGKRPPNEGPGDTAEMARRRAAWERRQASRGEYLATGLYLDLAMALIAPSATVLDLGCGTGRVLRLVGARRRGPLTLIGLDISLPMVDLACRALRAETRAAVVRGSSRRRFPFQSAVADVVLRRLAPARTDEVWRVLKPGGSYLVATWGPAHWRELSGSLQDVPRPRPSLTTAVLRDQGFVVSEHHTWQGTEALSPDDALDRLAIGPAAFHLDLARDRQRLHELANSQPGQGKLRLTIHAEITVAVKPHP
jgi:23S rRNA (guanine745-N1)-methyltransferase